MVVNRRTKCAAITRSDPKLSPVHETGVGPLEAVKAQIDAAYNAMTKPADKAAFVRRLKEKNMPLPTAAKKINEQDRIIAEIQAMPVEKQQSRIDEVYTGYTRGADKASFSKRLQAAKLPAPSTPKKVVSEQEKLIAELAAMLATATPAAPVKAGKGRAS